MASFTYRAIDGTSRIIEGKLDAASEHELEEVLYNEGLSLIEASRERFAFKRRLRLGEKDLLSFTYFLQLIFSSGMSLMSGLNDIAQQSVNKKVSGAASLLHAKLSSGASISESMSEHPGLFPPFYVSMIRAGEMSGNLEQVLNDIMTYLEWQISLRKDVKSLLAYPVIILTAVVSLITLLFVFVMPKLMGIIEQLRVEIPLPTKILMAVVGVFKIYWPLLIVMILALPVAFRIIRRIPAGRKFIDRLTIQIPVAGTFVKKLNHSRYFRTFATLYRSGLNMNETLRISADVVKNSVIADSFAGVTNAVLGGEQLSTALRNSGDFGPLLVNMVEIGEKTGTIDSTVVRISDIYDKEIPETLKKIFTVFEPILLVLLGGIVLLTLASFFLPLYKMIGGINR